MKIERLGYQAYQAYGEHVDFTAPTGVAMPPWEELPGSERLAWQLAAARVLDLALGEMKHLILGQTHEYFP